MELPKDLKDKIWNYCRLNDITDLNGFMIKTLKKGFDIEVYGLLGETLNDGEKDLNKALQDAINKNKIPVYSKFRPKIKYIKQVSTRPIIFKIFGNQANKLSLDYQKYLAKSLSKKFNIKGFKIFLKFVSAENPFKSKKY